MRIIAQIVYKENSTWKKGRIVQNADQFNALFRKELMEADLPPAETMAEAVALMEELYPVEPKYRLVPFRAD